MFIAVKEQHSSRIAEERDESLFRKSTIVILPWRKAADMNMTLLVNCTARETLSSQSE